LAAPEAHPHVTFINHDPADGTLNATRFIAPPVDVVPEREFTTFFIDPKKVVLSVVGAAPNVSILYA